GALMPLRDHFHPPLSSRRHWQALHTRWATALADYLNDDRLPSDHFAEPQVNIGGQVQVDMAALEDPAPTWIVPAVFAESFEVQVINTEAGPKLVAAIELISPSNKDRPESRRTFAAKCASYLAQGIHLIIIDVVTSRIGNLHNETMQLLHGAGAFQLRDAGALYGAAYRPVRRGERGEIDVWHAPLAIAAQLPTLPLALNPETMIPVDFEATYREACQRLRLD